jgi:hypothetical protein
MGPLRPGGTRAAPTLDWSTTRELGVVGFDLRQGGKNINVALIAASNSPAGASYSLPVSAGLATSVTPLVLRVWAEDATFADHTLPLGPAQPAVAPGPASAPSARPAGRPVPSGLPVVDTVDAYTTRAGVCFLGFPELAAAFQLPVEEVARRADQGRLALRQQGVLVPCWGDAAAGGRYFFAPRIESLFFAGNVTQIRFEAAPPIVTRSVATITAPGRTYAGSRAVQERNLQAVPTLPGEAEDDFWVWDSFLGGHPVFGTHTYAFDLAGLAAGTNAVAVSVELISVSVASHQFTVLLNGHALGGDTWTGPLRRSLRLPADPAWLLATGNSLQIVSTGDRLSLAYLDRFSVDYPRTLAPLGGPLLFSPADATALEAFGPAGSAVEVWDVSAPAQPVRLELGDPASGAERFRFQPETGHDYVTFLRGMPDRPDQLKAFGPGTLRGRRTGAEYVAIAPESLVDATAALAARRSAQGLTASVVSLAEIRHEFGFGLPVPAALANFLGDTHTNWTIPPRYAALVGDGTYDYRNNLGYADNLIPPLMTMTSYGRAVSDFLYSDIDHDGRPDLAVGRLPVQTGADLLRLLGQMDDFAARQVSAPQALVLADRPDDGGNFIANAQELQGHLDGTFGVGTILNDALDTDTVRHLLFADLSAGVSLLNYIGHGGRDRLGEGYLLTTDAGSVDFGSQQPVIVAMTCASGEFGLPGTPCLGEAVMLKAGRAPVAFFSPSGFSIDFQAQQLNLLLADGLKHQLVGTCLGDVIRRALGDFINQGGDTVTPAICNLLGDPALPLNFGDPPPTLSAQFAAGGLQISIVGPPGRTYQVESSDRLPGTDWRALGEIVTDATGAAGLVQALPTGPGQNYFRAVSVP